MIPQNFIADLLDRVNIVDVIEPHVTLKKAGANYVGLCPFHSEKTGSFTVSPVKQFYHCFGCGKNGTAISFLMEYESLSFPEAVEALAKQAGLTVPQEKNAPALQKIAKKKEQVTALNDVMQHASRYYEQQLKVSQKAIDYLKKRGLNGEIAKRFAIGYAPMQRDSLKNAFERYEAPQLVETGLVIVKQEDSGFVKRYDRFHDRIMFPIRNVRGHIVGFGGRVINGGEPKYLNSPETVLFQKGNELYGLFEAREAIRKSNYVLVVEGYMDVVALAQSGIAQCVATLGTACTSVQVQKLLRQTNRVVFSFDGDNAGRKAARRALEASLSLVNDTKTVSFLFLPSEHDPDSFVRKFGAKAFEEEIKKAIPFSEFLIQTIVDGNDLNTMEGRAKAEYIARPLCQNIVKSALKVQIVQHLARILQTSVSAFSGKKVVVADKGQRRVLVQARPAVVDLTRHMLRILLAYPEFARNLTYEQIECVQKRASDSGKLFVQIVQLIESLGELVTFASLTEALRAKEDSSHIDQLVQEANAIQLDKETARVHFDSACLLTRIQVIDEEMKSVLEENLAQEEKLERYKALRQDKTELLAEYDEIKNKIQSIE